MISLVSQICLLDFSWKWTLAPSLALVLILCHLRVTVIFLQLVPDRTIMMVLLVSFLMKDLWGANNAGAAAVGSVGLIDSIAAKV